METQELEKRSKDNFTGPPTSVISSDQVAASPPTKSVITSTVKKKKNQNQKTKEELLLERNLLNIIERQEKKKSEAAIARRVIKEFPNDKSQSESKQETSGEQSSSFSLTQILSIVSIVVSLARLYYNRKELIVLVAAPDRKVETAQRELVAHQREAQREANQEAIGNERSEATTEPKKIQN